THRFNKSAGLPIWTREARPEGVAHRDVRHLSHPLRLPERPHQGAFLVCGGEGRVNEPIGSTNRQDCRFGRAKRAPKGWRTGMCAIYPTLSAYRKGPVRGLFGVWRGGSREWTHRFNKSAGLPIWTREARPEGVAHRDVRHLSHRLRLPK